MKKSSLLLPILTVLLPLALSGFPNFSKTQGTQENDADLKTERRARLQPQTGHSLFINAVALSADGKYLVTGSWDKTARLWEVKSGNELRQFPENSGFVTAVAITSDNKYVISGTNDGTVQLWDAATGEAIREFKGHSYFVASIVLSRDGKYLLTGSWDKTARLWDFKTGKELRQFGNLSTRVDAAEFSADAKYVVTGCYDKIGYLWDLATGKEVRRFVGHSEWIRAINISEDNLRVVTAGEDNTARVWDTATGKELCRYRGHSSGVNAVKIMPKRQVLSGSFDGTQRIWDLDTCKEVKKFNWKVADVLTVEIAPNKEYLAVSSWPQTVTLFDSQTGRQLQRFDGRSASVAAITFSADDRYILTGCWDGVARLWDVASGKQTVQFEGHTRQVDAVAISNDNKYVVTGGLDNTARLWDRATGKELFTFKGHSEAVKSVAISPDSQYVATASQDQTARLWSTATGKEVRKFVGHTKAINSVAISPDGELLATGGEDGATRLWKIATGKEEGRLVAQSDEMKGIIFGADGKTETTLAPRPTNTNSVMFSTDGKRLLTGDDDQESRLWDVATRTELKKFTGDASSAALSSDGNYVVTGGYYSIARLFDASTGKKLHEFSGHSDSVNAVAISHDAKFAITGSSDSTARIWELATGKERCSLISFDDGNWAVVTPNGGFDASDLGEIEGLHWLMTDEPMTTYSLEIFMRDYYEPRLLPRLFRGEVFQKPRDISELNRTQPNVKIRDGYRPGNSDTINITVEVSEATSDSQRDKDGKLLTTGVYDLRLFRDGQLVGQFSEGPPQTLPASAGNNDKLLAWRKESAIKLDSSGKRVITFEGIELSRNRSLKTEFSAYAFNEDRVKSATARQSFNIPTDLTPRRKRAYVVMFGVNASEAGCKALNFAVNDVVQLQQTFVKKIKQGGQYEEVVEIPLIADYKTQPNGESVIAERSATKNNLKAVFDLLSGKKIDETLLADIPNARSIQRARPDDLVMIFFSTHGDTDNSGNFYLLPYDIGETELCSNKPLSNEEYDLVLTRSISSDHLSQWLRTVDAGEMIMIIDACHSAAAIESGEFKPGPMGSRGLGQLAYDKRMKILVATQAHSVALEYPELSQSVLSYMLTKEGIEDQRADFSPEDQVVLTSEWLLYGETRVPKWYEEKESEQAKQSQDFARKQLKPANKRLVHNVTTTESQVPSLFDFTRNKHNSVLFRR